MGNPVRLESIYKRPRPSRLTLPDWRCPTDISTGHAGYQFALTSKMIKPGHRLQFPVSFSNESASNFKVCSSRLRWPKTQKAHTRWWGKKLPKNISWNSRGGWAVSEVLNHPPPPYTSNPDTASSTSLVGFALLARKTGNEWGPSRSAHIFFSLSGVGSLSPKEAGRWIFWRLPMFLTSSERQRLIPSGPGENRWTRNSTRPVWVNHRLVSMRLRYWCALKLTRHSSLLGKFSRYKHMSLDQFRSALKVLLGEEISEYLTRGQVQAILEHLDRGLVRQFALSTNYKQEFHPFYGLVKSIIPL